MESNPPITSCDINTKFNEDINLYRLIGQDQAKTTLITWLECHYELPPINRKIETILFKGNTATTISRAFSNTFGNTKFKRIDANFLGNGICYSDYFMDGDDLTTYYIHNYERCNGWIYPELYRIFHDKILRVPEKIGYQPEQYHRFNRLILLSTSDIFLCDPHIVEMVDFTVELKPYTETETKAIILQRLRYLKWNYDDTRIIDTIVSVAGNNVKLAMEIVHWTVRCCKAQRCNRLNTRHLNNALHILK